jgi:hypothetical protein
MGITVTAFSYCDVLVSTPILYLEMLQFKFWWGDQLILRFIWSFSVPPENTGKLP